jgi:histidine triad (HIT) family protein
MTTSASHCPFCDIATGCGPAHVIDTWPDAMAFTPTNGGVTPGHTLVVPRAHVANAIVDPVVTGVSVIRAATLASQMIRTEQLPGANLITSIGQAATQSVFHLHWHIVPPPQRRRPMPAMDTSRLTWKRTDHGPINLDAKPDWDGSAAPFSIPSRRPVSAGWDGITVRRPSQPSDCFRR